MRNNSWGIQIRESCFSGHSNVRQIFNTKKDFHRMAIFFFLEFFK